MVARVVRDDEVRWFKSSHPDHSNAHHSPLGCP